ncbi:hypothetical protein J3B02_000383 [Coemansia erecta]|uniref:Homeobox domain-containing protein n=1 Tax=Coemansia asiatica TaxID=1052880 RepID=A0A9W7XLS0_9FUNG|nr:hypothetical protein LPJ64_001210 [Coemansia asiatica]KAJ2858248.1 hypothetical protein J3B02_000383 [Coemansia erecta]KAJ2889155.1 hypothetical protein FB639_000101 [Coemansia asiatica]
MIPDISSPVSTSTTAVSSPAFKQTVTDNLPHTGSMTATHTTIASAASIPAAGAELHAIVGQLPVPPASTFTTQTSSAHDYQQQQQQQQQNAVDSTLERLLMIGDVQPPRNTRPPDPAPSDMFAPMGFGSDVGIGSSSFFAHQSPSQSQSQGQSHTQIQTQAQAANPHQQHYSYPQQDHGQLHSSPEQIGCIGWSSSSSVPVWAPSYSDQRPLPTAAPLNRASPVSGYAHHAYSRATLPHPSVPPPVQYLNTMPQSYPMAMPAHSNSYLTTSYPQATIPAIPTTTSFGHSFGVGSSSDLRGMATASSACANLNGSDSDDISDNGSRSPGNRDTAVNWKNQPRNSISRRQKIIFYQWLLENSRFPFPNENDRLGRLAIDGISEKKFKYWFANIRCRQFTKHRDINGEMFFEPNAKFYESCLRLKLIFPHAIPAEIRSSIKRLNKGHQL